MAFFKGSIQREEKTVNLKGKEKTKTVKEHYVFNCPSDTYTEAEVILNKKMELEKQTFEISNIARVKLSDVLVDKKDNAVLWFKCKVTVDIENDKGKVKKVSHFVLVNAIDAEKAYQIVYEFSGSLSNFEIPNVDITNITDYIE